MCMFLIYSCFSGIYKHVEFGRNCEYKVHLYLMYERSYTSGITYNHWKKKISWDTQSILVFGFLTASANFRLFFKQ